MLWRIELPAHEVPLGILVHGDVAVHMHLQVVTKANGCQSNRLPRHITGGAGLACAPSDPGAPLTEVFMGLERVTSTRPSLGWAWLDSALIALRAAARATL